MILFTKHFFPKALDLNRYKNNDKVYKMHKRKNQNIITAELSYIKYLKTNNRIKNIGNYIYNYGIKFEIFITIIYLIVLDRIREIKCC